MNKSVIAGALLGLVLGSGLVGCSGPSGPSAGPSVDPSRVSPTDLPTPPTVTDPQGDVKDLTLGDCNTEAGEQKVDASLTSTLDSRQDFVVSLSWTTSANDVMGRGFKVLRNVAPGETREFTIKAKVADGAAVCVPGVSYGSMKG